MSNGGIIGAVNVPTPTVASGVWGLDELYEARLGNIWPLAVSSFAMELVEPSSIAFSGTSAAIVGNGSVTFTAVSPLSLNGVFTSNYDNYMVILSGNASTGTTVFGRLRVAGTDNSTSSSYVRQRLEATGTSVVGARDTGDRADVAVMNSVQRTGFLINIYGPALVQPTAWRTVSANDASSARIEEYAVTHNQSTAYDGITISTNVGTLTGRIAVYGLRG